MTKKQKKVSICIPTYGEPCLLDRLLHSISIQTFSDYEIIITDDTGDKSVENVVNKWSDLNIYYSKNKNSLGAPENWNEGIRRATGMYVKIMHHDDSFLCPDSLQNFIDLIEVDPGVEFAFCASKVCKRSEEFIRITTVSPDELTLLQSDPNTLYPYNFIGAPSAVIFNRERFVPFDNSLQYVVDIDFYIRVLGRQNVKVAYCPKPLIQVSAGGDQLTAQCAGKKDVELFEWLYLFRKINRARFPNLSHLRFIWHLLARFNVTTLREIRNTKFKGKIPWIVRVYLLANFLSKLRPFKRLWV